VCVLGERERLTVMPTPDPKSYADRWVRAWNAHDVEAVLDHFHDDVVFTSPVAARVVPESGGVVRGKVALRDYWSTALSQQANLQFEIVGVYRGESSRHISGVAQLVEIDVLPPSAALFPAKCRCERPRRPAMSARSTRTHSNWDRHLGLFA
jgi:hypothetical protein